MLHHIDEGGLTAGLPAGLTVAAAAVHLGITPTAVRRRIQRGTLKAWKAGGVWLVDVAAGAPRDRPVHAPRSTPRDRPQDRPVQDAGSPVEALLRDELADLRERLTEAARALEREQTASAELRRLLGNAQLQLAAPREDQAEPEPAKPRRRAWRFWQRSASE